jgi:hypothetical protein
MTVTTSHTRRRTWPAPVRVVLVFVSLWVPLVLLALATGWRDGGMPAEEPDSLLIEVVLYGSAVSGPLTAQLILVVLAAGACRRGRLGVVATAGLALMGAAITYQGTLATIGEHAHAPAAVGTIAGLGFVTVGVSLLVTSVRQLIVPRLRAETREPTGVR